MGLCEELSISTLKILPDNPGNQSDCHIPIFINMSYNKGNFILLAHGSGIFPLDLAFLHVLLAGIAFHALDICLDCDLIQAFSSHGQDTHQQQPLPARYGLHKS